jgi:hypothetical protein
VSQVSQVSRQELLARRESILRRLGVSYDELRERAEASTLMADEWGAWEALRDIAFLLGDEPEPA